MTNSVANMVGACSFVVCNAVMWFASVPKTKSTCCRGSEGGSAGGYHRIQLLFASGTFSDHRKDHFQVAGVVLIFSRCWSCSFVCWYHPHVRMPPPADTCGRVSLLERGGGVVHKSSVIVF